jgi:hypothetical protein
MTSDRAAHDARSRADRRPVPTATWLADQFTADPLLTARQQLTVRGTGRSPGFEERELLPC